MATAKPNRGIHAGGRSGRVWAGGLFLALLIVGLIVFFRGEMISGYAEAGSAYGAKNACSCRFLADRALDSCATDFVPGMELVMLSEDDEARSVTAYVPLIASETATYRPGFGCMLDPAVP